MRRLRPLRSRTVRVDEAFADFRAAGRRAASCAGMQVCIMAMCPSEEASCEPEVPGDQGLVASHFGDGSLEDHAACIEDRDLVGELEREAHILLDEEDRVALVLEARDG